MKPKTKKNILYILFGLFIVLLFFVFVFSFSNKWNTFYNNKNKKSFSENYEESNDEQNYGFVITRHVKSEETNKLWLMCIQQIRKFHPLQKIIIIDDNSNYDFVKNETNLDLTNCITIDSEFKGRAELLPYYYFYKNKWFDKMIFIHDSVFINKKIDVSNIKDVKFLWYFDGGEGDGPDTPIHIEKLINYTNTNYTNEFISLYHNSNKWKGCWGVMSVIEYNYLKYLADKYNFLELINHITNRFDRGTLERIFGIMCNFENPNMINDISNISIYGHYIINYNNRNSGNYNYNDYLEDISSNNMNSDINKLFFGR
jgi:hypothetical protein